jgi:hypothetical protein
MRRLSMVKGPTVSGPQCLTYSIPDMQTTSQCTVRRR